MIKKKLDLVFLTENGKKFRLNLGDPKDDLDDDTIKSAMDNIIDLDVFNVKNQKLSAKSEAKITTTSVENFNI